MKETRRRSPNSDEIKIAMTVALSPSVELMLKVLACPVELTCLGFGDGLMSARIDDDTPKSLRLLAAFAGCKIEAL